MRVLAAGALGAVLASLISNSYAAVWQRGVSAEQQYVFRSDEFSQSWQESVPSYRHGNGHENRDWYPLEYASGISPYHDAPGADISPPKGCQVSGAAFLIRHSCIHANDDEWEEFMEPFAERVYAKKGVFPAQGPLGFLNEWKSLITAENAEQLTEFGKRDAYRLGKRIRNSYSHLFPPKDLGRDKKKKHKSQEDDEADAKKVKTPFKVWSASSQRDIDTAKAFIKGAFPKKQRGERDEGDGKYLSLVEVPNKDADWGASLTPHKICPRFTKKDGKADARTFLQHWGPGPLEKLRSLAPDFDFELNDVIAVFMLCGYETVIQAPKLSKFCSPQIFDIEDWKDFEYYFDVDYHKMVGYGSDVGAPLGIHWVNTSTHNLLSLTGDKEHSNISSGKDPHLPDPSLPPNATHSQRFFAYFTHREEPAVALTALGLWNQTKVGPLPLDRRVDDRAWITSHVLPFLGHVALERIQCKGAKSDYIRAIVNGAAQPLDDCHSGPGGSCPLADFAKYVEHRVELYGDFAAACSVQE